MLLDLVYLLAAVTVGPVYLLSRLLKGKRLASPLRRLGFVEEAAGEGETVWFHGVSVGEVLASRSLVAELRRQRPAARVVVTSTTVTGLAVARQTYPDLEVLESPYDLSGAVGRFLRRVRPSALVLMELELWPNLLARCRRRQLPVVVANAKMSERSRDGYRRVLRLMPRFLDGVGAFLTQDAVHARRIEQLGVEEARVHVVGNLKYDNVTWQADRPSRGPLRREHGIPDEAPVVIFGSTHAGEESLALEACRDVAAAVPELRIVLAPRHPERVDEVIELANTAGWQVGRRSTPGSPAGSTCLVVDTMGELASLYGLADVAFVGGTLVPVGGHNLLEPAALGMPLVVGSHLHTVASTAAELEAAGALQIVGDAAALAVAIERGLNDASVRERASAGAAAVISRHKGSARRTIVALEGLLTPSLAPEPDCQSTESTHHG